VPGGTFTAPQVKADMLWQAFITGRLVVLLCTSTVAQFMYYLHLQQKHWQAGWQAAV